MADKEFYAKIYALARKVPSGSVTTYGALGAAAGRLHGGRQVGKAMACAPRGQGIPAHRVLRSDGALAPADVFGAGIQHAMLEEEGVTFLPSGRVNLRKHFFQPHADEEQREG